MQSLLRYLTQADRPISGRTSVRFTEQILPRTSQFPRHVRRCYQLFLFLFFGVDHSIGRLRERIYKDSVWFFGLFYV